MRNQRSNFIPVPMRAAKSMPKPLTKSMMSRKTASSQTERVVLVKEEQLTVPSSLKREGDGGLRRDYVKAVNYINSCHVFVNSIVEKNNAQYPHKPPMFMLPMTTNYLPLFNTLAGKKRPKELREPKEMPMIKEAKVEIKEEIKEVKKVVHQEMSKPTRSAERKSKSSFGVKKTEEAPIDPAPVGDYNKQQVSSEQKYATQVADLVKQELQQFLTNLQEDVTKTILQSPPPPPPPSCPPPPKMEFRPCQNVNIVKNRLEELSKIYHMQKNIEDNGNHHHHHQKGDRQRHNPAPLPPSPPTPPPRDPSEECSFVTDFDFEQERRRRRGPTPPPSPPRPRFTSFDGSGNSIITESSDIKTDSEIEIHI